MCIVYLYDEMGAPIDTSIVPIIHNYVYSTGNWKDQLISYDGQTIQYDSMGNPITYLGYTLTWDNIRELSTVTGNNLNASYEYGENGIRTSKTVNGVKHTYILEGTKILYEIYGDTLILYLYDESGAPIGFAYRKESYAKDVFDNFFFTKNLQGDILNIYDEAGVKVASYTYDAWGNHTVTNHTGEDRGRFLVSTLKNT